MFAYNYTLTKEQLSTTLFTEVQYSILVLCSGKYLGLNAQPKIQILNGFC